MQAAAGLGTTQGRAGGPVQPPARFSVPPRWLQRSPPGSFNHGLAAGGVGGLI